MKQLSDKKYWDSIYKDIKQEKNISNFNFLNKLKNEVKDISRDYSNYLIWENIYPKYLPKSSDVKAIEIGCAPGNHIIALNKRFGYIPYGVEYSETGCNLTMENFLNAGLSAENVIQADFFDKNFQSVYTNRFDMVLSLGFIEHFDNVLGVIGNHIKLLKNNGYLVVLIPNLRGINFYMLKFFNMESLLGHNFSIMNKTVFKNLFKNKNIDFLYCDYVGTFSFGLFNTDKKWKYYLWRFLLLLQRPFDFLWRILFKNKYMKSRHTSPYLMFIGKKK
jgi:SAM-dependent methyltransferase